MHISETRRATRMDTNCCGEYRATSLAQCQPGIKDVITDTPSRGNIWVHAIYDHGGVRHDVRVCVNELGFPHAILGSDNELMLS